MEVNAYSLLLITKEELTDRQLTRLVDNLNALLGPEERLVETSELATKTLAEDYDLEDWFK